MVPAWGWAHEIRSEEADRRQFSRGRGGGLVWIVKAPASCGEKKYMCAAYFPREVCENPAFKWCITFYEWALYHTLRSLLILVPHLCFLFLTPLLNSKSKSRRKLLSDPRGRSFAVLMLFLASLLGVEMGDAIDMLQGCHTASTVLGRLGAQ